MAHKELEFRAVLEEREREVKELRHEVEVLRNQVAELRILATTVSTGLTREVLVDVIAMKPELVAHLYGFPNGRTCERTLEMMRAMFGLPDRNDSGTFVFSDAAVTWYCEAAAMVYPVSSDVPADSLSLLRKEQQLITLLKIRRNFPAVMLAQMFGVSESTISRTWQRWFGAFGVMGRMLTMLPLTSAQVDLLHPQDSPASARKVGLVIDGRDIRTNTPRKDGFGTNHYSDKSNGSTVMGITGVLLCGLCRMVTPLVLGRCSEMALVAKSRYLFATALAPSHKVMVDKGFKNIGMDLPHANAVVMPHFKKRDGIQFSEEENESNRGIASSRWVVEAQFARAASFALVEDEVARENFHLLAPAWFWANGTSIFQAPFRQPTADTEFKTLGEAWKWARTNIMHQAHGGGVDAMEDT